MAGLDPIPFNVPSNEPGKKREESVKSSLINVASDTKTGEEERPLQSPS